MIKRIFILPLAICAAFTLSASATNLNQAVQHSVKTNPEVLQVAKARRAADHAVRAAWGGYLPTVDLHAAIGYEHSENATTAIVGNDDDFTRKEFSLEARQLIFDGFGVASEVDRTQAIVDSTAHNVAGQSNDTALMAVEAYINVLKEKKLVRVAKDNVAVHRRIWRKIKKRSKSGVSRPVDSTQADGRLALAIANLKSEQGRLHDAKTMYYRVVGMHPQNLRHPRFPSSLLPRTEGDAIQTALHNHPTLMSANADIEATEAQHKGAKSFFYPQVHVVAGLSRNHDIDGVAGPNHDYFVLLEANWNLYRGGSDLARVRETAELIEEAEQVRDNTARQVVESTRRSWISYRTNSRLKGDRYRHMVASRKTADAYTQQFNLGQRTLLDLLDTENEYFSSRREYYTVKYDLLFAKYRLLNSMGTLVRSLGLMDPEEATLVDNSKQNVLHRVIMKKNKSTNQMAAAAANGATTVATTTAVAATNIAPRAKMVVPTMPQMVTNKNVKLSPDALAHARQATLSQDFIPNNLQAKQQTFRGNGMGQATKMAQNNLSQKAASTAPKVQVAAVKQPSRAPIFVSERGRPYFHPLKNPKKIVRGPNQSQQTKMAKAKSAPTVVQSSRSRVANRAPANLFLKSSSEPQRQAMINNPQMSLKPSAEKMAKVSKPVGVSAAKKMANLSKVPQSHRNTLIVKTAQSSHKPKTIPETEFAQNNRQMVNPLSPLSRFEVRRDRSGHPIS